MLQHRWLAEVLEAMGFPPDFRDLVALLYRDAELVVKVTGHHGDAFTPLNGVKQRLFRWNPTCWCELAIINYTVIDES
jgi:hypothetical protein